MTNGYLEGPYGQYSLSWTSLQLQYAKTDPHLPLNGSLILTSRIWRWAKFTEDLDYLGLCHDHIIAVLCLYHHSINNPHHFLARPFANRTFVAPQNGISTNDRIAPLSATLNLQLCSRWLKLLAQYKRLPDCDHFLSLRLMTPVDNYQISHCLNVTIYWSHLEKHISESTGLPFNDLEGPLFFQ